MNDNAKKDNRGYLYPNKNKNKPTQPDYTGKVLIDGKELRISAWENQTPEGNKYLSLAFLCKYVGLRHWALERGTPKFDHRR